MQNWGIELDTVYELLQNPIGEAVYCISAYLQLV